jgi:serine/threonine protein kinase
MNQIDKYQKRVYKVLAEQNFIVGDAERKTIQKRTTNGRRYFFMVVKRIEGKNTIERFIKIPENNTKKLLLPFQRQIEIAKHIKSHRIISTRGVVASNYDPKKGIPFVVMETFPTNQSKIGFIEGDSGVELLGIREARQTIDQLQKFHSISIQTLPTRLKKILKIYPGDYKGFRREVFRYLNKKVKPLDGKGKTEPFHKVLERRLRIPEIKTKAKKLLAQLEPIIDSRSSRVPSIVHGDMAPNNLYVFNSGDVELLDLEWVGVFKNKAIAMILDFGNLRARSWRNEKFRNALDDALIKIYRAKRQEKIGRAIVQLSILRSHIQLSGFFENYARPKQKDLLQTRRRKQTESDIAKAFV